LSGDGNKNEDDDATPDDGNERAAKFNTGTFSKHSNTLKGDTSSRKPGIKTQ